MSTLYLTNEVDDKYIISVVELQKEGKYYSLSKDDVTAITAYIAETAAAPEAVVPSQATSKKAGAKKRHSNTSASASKSEVEVDPETTTSSGKSCKRRNIIDV